MKKLRKDQKWAMILVCFIILASFFGTLVYGLQGNVSSAEVQDKAAREMIIRLADILYQHHDLIMENYKAIKELENRGKTKYGESHSIQVVPIPVPIIPVPPDAISPRLPTTRVNKSKKWT